MKKLLIYKIVLLFACFLLPAKVFGASFENEKLKLNIETQKTDSSINVLAHFTLKNGWHISWENPGDAGVPTTFFVNSQKTDPLETSVPEVFLYDDIIVQYGFSKEAYYLLNTTDVKSKLRVTWTACKDECEGQEAFFEITPSTTPSFEKEYKKAVQTFPLKQKEPLNARIENGELVLYLKNIKGENPHFISAQKDILKTDAEQSFSQNKLKIKNETGRFPLSGLIIEKNQVYHVELKELPPNILWILLLAFLGGVILNLMPCVFPVLSLKALHMVQNSKIKSGRFLRAFSYTSGVVLSFLSIVLLLFLFKSAGFALGWGFQLQSPVFVFVMIVLFVVILLFLLNVFRFSPPFLTKISKISTLNSFLTGFFAVLIASPCTGPFMGAAIGYALFETPEVYFPVFLSLGLGYALPFALLEMFPFVMKKIMPKPGAWMVGLEYVLAVPIVLTILWLGWVFYHQVFSIKQEEAWAPYSQEVLQQSLENGDAVFIDFTAKWCLTCLLNERTVLSSKAFMDYAKENEIKLLKADWTNQDDEIFKALKKYGRSSVPLYVYYPQDSEHYVILPQILRVSDVISEE